MQLLRFRDLPVTPWANGAGITRSVATYIDNRMHQDFLWRVSMATVGKTSPFSTFTGVDRTIAVLQGSGIHLKVEGNETLLTQDSDPFPFRGEQKTVGGSISGETLDLNVMTRRGLVTHTVTKHVTETRDSIEAVTDQTILVSASNCTFSIENHFEDLECGDALVDISAGTKIEFSARDIATLYAISFHKMQVGLP
jgi:uncharacterized protein